MKFIVSSTYLLKQLQVLGGVINNSNTLPILDNFLFELNHSKLTISASDLETTMSSTMEVESDSEGSIALPARLLLDTLKTFPEQPLTFVVEDMAMTQRRYLVLRWIMLSLWRAYQPSRYSYPPVLPSLGALPGDLLDRGGPILMVSWRV
jgi:hypothetical protein